VDCNIIQVTPKSKWSLKIYCSSTMQILKEFSQVVLGTFPCVRTKLAGCLHSLFELCL